MNSCKNPSKHMNKENKEQEYSASSSFPSFLEDFIIVSQLANRDGTKYSSFESLNSFLLFIHLQADSILYRFSSICIMKVSFSALKIRPVIFDESARNLQRYVHTQKVR